MMMPTQTWHVYRCTCEGVLCTCCAVVVKLIFPKAFLPDEKLSPPLYMFSLIHFFLSLFPGLSRLREEGKTSSLPSSPLPLSFMYTFTYIVVWPEVSLALLNSHKVLSVVPYDLARPESQSPCLGCSTVPIL